MNRKAITATVVLLIAAAGGAYYYKQRRRQPAPRASAAKGRIETMKADAAPMISIVKARQAEFRETVLVSGSLVAREEILVAPEIEGLRVVELFADEGSKVTKGPGAGAPRVGTARCPDGPERRVTRAQHRRHRAGRKARSCRPKRAPRKPATSSTARSR